MGCSISRGDGVFPYALQFIAIFACSSVHGHWGLRVDNFRLA